MNNNYSSYTNINNIFNTNIIERIRNQNNINDNIINITPKISNLIKDVGNKYTQLYIEGISPDNVIPYENDNIGIRMEDEAKIINIDDNKIAIIIADGHGSEEMMMGYHCGGYECANFAVNFISKKIRSLKNKTVDDILSQMIKYFKSLFKILQKKCLKYMLEGGVEIKIENINGKEIIFPISNNYDIENDILWDNEKNKNNEKPQSFTSPIDGNYFKNIYTVEKLRDYISLIKQYYNNNVQYGKDIVFGKGIEICKDMKDIPFRVPIYCNTLNEKKTSLESGTTLTLSVILRDNFFRYYIITSHVGDSHVILYRKDGNKFIKKKLTDDHSVKNNDEVKRCEKYGLVPVKRHFTCIKKQDIGLMPSRSIGHPFLSNFGIIEYPFISCERLLENDIVIFASDGLWDLDDDMDRKIDQVIIDNYDRDENDICNILYSLYKSSKEKKDNLVMCVLKLRK